MLGHVRMARVVLLSATPAADPNPEHLAPLLDLRARAALDRFGIHSVVVDPENADVILFVEGYGAGGHFEEVRRHPLVRRYREKCFLFSANTYAIPFLPGIYTGIDRRWASRRTAAGFYLGTPENEFTTFVSPSAEMPHLFSFVGSTRNAPVRHEIAKLNHPRGFIQDTSSDYERVLRREMPPAERRAYHCRYAERTHASKFVLCPRGLSASSIRLFETMRMGRAPVILSDDWSEPSGPLWSEFSIRVPERDCPRLPQILEAREAEAVAMGNRARAAWVDWFSEEAAFHRIVEWCLAIAERRVLPESIGRFSAFAHYLHPLHMRRAAARTLRSLRQIPRRAMEPATAGDA